MQGRGEDGIFLRLPRYATARRMRPRLWVLSGEGRNSRAATSCRRAIVQRNALAAPGFGSDLRQEAESSFLCTSHRFWAVDADAFHRDFCPCFLSKTPFGCSVDHRSAPPKSDHCSLRVCDFTQRSCVRSEAFHSVTFCDVQVAHHEVRPTMALHEPDFLRCRNGRVR